MAMPAMPGARFAMIEPKIGFGPLEAFFDGPAQARNGCEFGKRRTGRNEAKVIGPLGGSTPAAADEKKAFEAGIARPGQTDAGPIVKPEPLASFSCGMTGPGFCLERIGQRCRIGLHKTVLVDEPQAVVGPHGQNIGLTAPFEHAP